MLGSQFYSPTILAIVPTYLVSVEFGHTPPHLTSPHLTSPHLISSHLTLHCIPLVVACWFERYGKLLKGSGIGQTLDDDLVGGV
mmetsp:Transcript_6981/g.13662  ORF Transcript_6981/g.13662 Transcript_6981/m.13662 type:complete len:84 (+) Transcript_6981:187-438(+)